MSRRGNLEHASKRIMKLNTDCQFSFHQLKHLHYYQLPFSYIYTIWKISTTTSASTYEAGHGHEDAGHAGPRVTTKPPIVWFPGDPDCGEGELGAAARLDTFQVVAFLLSVFNVASIMVSNVNNNNNNNNVNSNAESVNDNNINESNTNAQVSSMSNVGLGGRGLGRDRRSSEELARERSVEEELVREDLHSTVWELLGLVTRSHLAPSTTCLEQLFCQASELAAARGGFSSVAAEMSSLLLAQSVPSLQPRHRWRLVAAAKRGRAGLGCSEVAARCEAEDWSFLNMADTFTWSSAADRGHVERLVAWAYNKK